MTTIKDVAFKTNLSIGTISRYLNGKEVKKENKEKIEQAVKELNFTFNPMARGLRTNKTFSIGVLVPSISDLFCTMVIGGIEDVFDQINYSIIVCDASDNLEKEEKKIAFLKEKYVDGIIIMPVGNRGEHVKILNSNGIPIVLIDRLIDNFDCDAIVCDNVNGAYKAVENIIKYGHRKIGIIAGPQHIYTAKERLEGYLRALNDYNIKINEDYIQYSGYERGSGDKALNALFEMEDKPTAIFATNYETTLTALKYTNEKKIRIGEDISLFGYDQNELFQLLNPPLSVVVQPMREIGRSAAELLFKRMNGDNSNFPMIVRLKTKIVVTNSVKNIL